MTSEIQTRPRIKAKEAPARAHCVTQYRPMSHPVSLYWHIFNQLVLLLTDFHVEFQIFCAFHSFHWLIKDAIVSSRLDVQSGRLSKKSNNAMQVFQLGNGASLAFAAQGSKDIFVQST